MAEAQPKLLQAVAVDAVRLCWLPETVHVEVGVFCG